MSWRAPAPRQLQLNLPEFACCVAAWQDPELKEVMEDIEANGQGAMMKYMQVRAFGCGGGGGRVLRHVLAVGQGNC